jgi:hypothetical protein
MSIQYREKTTPLNFNSEYTQLNNYHHSFNISPKTSLLRFAISPSQHIFNNLDYNNLLLKDPRYIPLEQSIFLEYDPRIKYLQGLKHVKQQNDYIEYSNKNKIPIQYKNYY